MTSLLAGLDLLVHLVEVELHELLVVLGLVEKGIEVALDDLPHAIEDAHGPPYLMFENVHPNLTRVPFAHAFAHPARSFPAP